MVDKVVKLELAKNTETEALAWPTVVAECGILNLCGSSTTFGYNVHYVGTLSKGDGLVPSCPFLQLS
jgi:hypothetical protein